MTIQERIYEKAISLGRQFVEEADGDFRSAIIKAFEFCKSVEEQTHADYKEKRLFRRLVCLGVMIAKRERRVREQRN